MADGKPYKIELLKTVDIEIRSYGALDHMASYKNKVKRVVVPRSARALYYHRLASLVKVLFHPGFPLCISGREHFVEVFCRTAGRRIVCHCPVEAGKGAVQGHLPSYTRD